MGIILPSQGSSCKMPPRLEDNWVEGHTNCYAKYWIYPSTAQELGGLIEDVYTARIARAHLINNSNDMMKKNSKCRIQYITH